MHRFQALVLYLQDCHFYYFDDERQSDKYNEFSKFKDYKEQVQSQLQWKSTINMDEIVNEEITD